MGCPPLGDMELTAGVAAWDPQYSFTRLLSQSQLENEATGTRVYREFWVKKSRNVIWPFLPTSLLPSLIGNNLQIFPCFSRDPGISQQCNLHLPFHLAWIPQPVGAGADTTLAMSRTR